MMKQITIFLMIMMLCAIGYLGYENHELKKPGLETRVLWKDSVITRVKTKDTIVYNVKHITRVIKEDTVYQVGFRYTDRVIDIGCTTFWSTKGESKYKLKYLIPPDTIKHIVMLWRNVPYSNINVNGYDYDPVIVKNNLNMQEQRQWWDRAWIGSTATMVVFTGIAWLVK